MSLNNNRNDLLDFTREGQNLSPYQCEFCTVLLLPHSDPNRLTKGQLWICPRCGTVIDDSSPTESLMGARPRGTLMDDFNQSNQANSIQFIDEEKGLPNTKQNRVEQLTKEEIYSDRDFRKKGIVKDSIQVAEEVSK